MYEVVLNKQAEKIVNKQQKYIKTAFYKWSKIELPENPYDANDGKIVKTDYEGLQVYKKRFGNFRALFTINDETVIVKIFKFKSRGQSYKA